jgi:hypothetical protein
VQQILDLSASASASYNIEEAGLGGEAFGDWVELEEPLLAAFFHLDIDFWRLTLSQT